MSFCSPVAPVAVSTAKHTLPPLLWLTIPPLFVFHIYLPAIHLRFIMALLSNFVQIN